MSPHQRVEHELIQVLMNCFNLNGADFLNSYWDSWSHLTLSGIHISDPSVKMLEKWSFFASPQNVADST